MKLQKARSSALKPEISDEVRQILHRVGLALCVLGLLGIGVTIYCIVNGVSYSSSFNIFAVISGIYLWRGHPWYVRWVTRVAGFYAAAFCTMVPMAPFLFPVDLGALELQLHPGGVIVGTVATIGVVVFLIWVYQEVRQAPVLAAYTVSGYSPGPFCVAPLCGAMLARKFHDRVVRSCADAVISLRCQACAPPIDVRRPPRF